MRDGRVEIEFVFSCCLMIAIEPMMKPAWKSSQAGSFKKAPLCAETLENICMTELNIVNIIIQPTKNTTTCSDAPIITLCHCSKQTCIITDFWTKLSYHERQGPYHIFYLASISDTASSITRVHVLDKIGLLNTNREFGNFNFCNLGKFLKTTTKLSP